MVRIIQISDPHVSQVRGFFVQNFIDSLEAAKALQPDLVVISGDLAIDGADRADDLAFTRHLIEQSGIECAIIPGNHDVGEEPGAVHVGQPINADRMAQWLQTFGTDRFSLRLGAWRLIGLNGHLFGSGLPREAEQWDWLDAELSSVTGPLALFMHKPLFMEGPDEETDGLLSVPKFARERLTDMMSGLDLRFVGSGHLHQGLVRKVDGVTHVWSPSTAFESGTHKHPRSDLRLGMVDIEFGEAGTCEAKLVPMPQLRVIDYLSLKEDGRYPFLKDVPPQPFETDWRHAG